MFRDRYEAGTLLANALIKYKNKKQTLILAIPRGALQIGEVLHKELNLPLDIVITKKIPHPMNEELAIGAVGFGGEFYLDHELSKDVSDSYIEEQKEHLGKLVEERYQSYHSDEPNTSLQNKTVIIVDDGIATGSTIIAAIHIIRKQNVAKIIVAIPVAPINSIEKVKAGADEVICLNTPDPFFAIGAFYENFPQVEDEEAINILRRCKKDKSIKHMNLCR